MRDVDVESLPSYVFTRPAGDRKINELIFALHLPYHLFIRYLNIRDYNWCGTLVNGAIMAESIIAKSFFKIETLEMHTGGEPLRIILSGYPEISGDTILAKRRFVRDQLDHLRKALMLEPRGHYDMYGALLVQPDHPTAELATLFLHNEGYSTMCGHATLALARYAVDFGLVEPVSPETEVNLQCPCGLVKSFVEYDDNTKSSGRARFHSVPAFVFRSGN